MWMYSMAHHVQKEHAVALTMRAKDTAALAVRVLYDVSATEKFCRGENVAVVSVTKAPHVQSQRDGSTSQKNGGEVVSRNRQQANAQDKGTV